MNMHSNYAHCLWYNVGVIGTLTDNGVRARAKSSQKLNVARPRKEADIANRARLVANALCCFRCCIFVCDLSCFWYVSVRILYYLRALVLWIFTSVTPRLFMIMTTNAQYTTDNTCTVRQLPFSHDTMCYKSLSNKHMKAQEFFEFFSHLVLLNHCTLESRRDIFLQPCFYFFRWFHCWTAPYLASQDYMNREPWSGAH